MLAQTGFPASSARKPAGRRSGVCRGALLTLRLLASAESESGQAEGEKGECGGFRDNLAVRPASAPRPNSDALVKAAAAEPGTRAADGDIVLIQRHLCLRRQESAASNC